MFKKIILSVIVALATLNYALACHALPLVGYNVSVGATGVTINGNSDPATCGCGPYWMQTEISCSGTFYGQTMPSCMQSTMAAWASPSTSYLNYPYYNSLLNVPGHNLASGWFDNCLLEPYHATFIPFSDLCPGKVYFIRSREVLPNGANGPWTAVTSFTVPGTPPPPPPPSNMMVTLNANPTPVICCGNVAITAVFTGTNWANGCIGNVPSCERNMTVTPTFSWAANNTVTTLAGTGTTFTTSTPTLNVVGLSSTTTFSLWLAYLCVSPSGSFTYTPPALVPIFIPFSSLSASNIATSFTTAPASAVWTQALKQCCTGAGVLGTTPWPATITVPVIPSPVALSPTATPNTCLSSPNFTFTETATTPSNFNVNWNFGDGTTGTGTNVAHSYTAAGIYTVTVTKSSCGPCSATTSFTVQVYPSPIISPTVNSPVCIGGTASFTASNPSIATYTWSGPNNFSSNLSNPSINNATNSNAGIYTVVATATNGCVGTGTVNLNTYQATITANANLTVCINNPINLTASGSGTYSWAGPNNFTSNLQNPSPIANNLSGGIYNVTATLTGGCLASASTSISMASTTVSASHNGPLCAGNSFTLFANGPGTFSWAGPGGFTSNQQNPIVNSPGVSAGGIYTVTATNSLGCVATATTLVTLPSPKIVTPFGSGTICEGGSLSFEARTAGTSYIWNGPNGYYANTANTILQDAQIGHNGIFTVTVTDMNGCVAKGTITVVVNSNPKIGMDLSKAKSSCAPACNLEFGITGEQNLTDVKWTFGNGNESISKNPKSICYNKGGNYTIELTATGANGCKAKINNAIEMYNNPIADFNYNQGNGYTWVNGEVKFTDVSTGANINSWEWNFGNNNIYKTENVNHTYQDTGSFNVNLTVTSVNGCTATVTKKVVVEDENLIYVPNAFTPNGDGSNDIFMAVSRSQIKFEMQIFNRGGELLFHSSDINKGWDGTFKGQLAENNVYVYKITYINKNSKSKTFTGSVTLVR